MTSRAAKPRPMPARMARQTAGCRNERPLFRDCSLQRKYQLRRVEAETTCSERYGAMGVRGANRRANNPSTRPDHQCPARGRGPQCCIDAYKVRTRRGSGTAARWFLIRLLKPLLDRAIACELRRPGRVARYVRIHYITGDSAYNRRLSGT